MAALCQTLRQSVAALFIFLFFVLIALLEVLRSRTQQAVETVLGYWADLALYEELCLPHT